ncbi:uncharacterized protein LOC105804340 isoform X5 [Gossypium raimondii]|uniref:uncharacterized protein LOC105804340 isoform X5 n=1 Tax=Gossypium raimondii TaxID=29730 RepID=UPI00227C6931|nr:uncharacterized protein LOC105804340 isoform X5 [Gossypium raimondii]
MRPMPMEFVTDPDDQGSAMKVDDVDTPEIFGEGVVASNDFDDSGIDKKTKKNRFNYGGGAAALKWDDHPAIMDVGVVDGTSEAIFQTLMSLGPSRSEWWICHISSD